MAICERERKEGEEETCDEDYITSPSIRFKKGKGKKGEKGGGGNGSLHSKFSAIKTNMWGCGGKKRTARRQPLIVCPSFRGGKREKSSSDFYCPVLILRKRRQRIQKEGRGEELLKEVRFRSIAAAGFKEGGEKERKRTVDTLF